MICEILRGSCTNKQEGRCSFCIVAERKIVLDPEGLPSQERSGGTQEFTEGNSLVVIDTYKENGVSVDYTQRVSNGVYSVVRGERKNKSEKHI